MALFLQAEGLTFRYFEQSRHPILAGADFAAEEGKTTVVVGPSGCGKSTLAAVCAGLYPENGGILSEGRILLRGRPLADMTAPQRARELSLLFQNPDLQFCMDSLREELYFCLENLGVDPGMMDARIQALAEQLGLTPLLDRRLHTLSGGEKQKAALCCLFALGSKGLFLDEPFANIDPASTREIIGLLDRRRREEGLTIIAIDHRLEPWLSLADEFVLLGEGGRVVKRGITRESLPQERELFARLGVAFPAEEGENFPRPQAGCPKASGDQTPAVRLKNLTLRCPGETAGAPGVPLLENACADFPRGCLTAILGPSGAGKTSLFYALLKRRPYEGTIELEGRPLSRLRPAALYRRLGMVFQNPGSQFVSQNVRQEVELSLKAWGRSGDALELLDEFGLAPYVRYSPYMLSQGQQRRLAVLSMLACGQEILLLDEPTYGQDARSTQALMELLRRQMRERGLTVVMITHDEELARKEADCLYRLQGRRLEKEGGMGR